MSYICAGCHRAAAVFWFLLHFAKNSCSNSELNEIVCNLIYVPEYQMIRQQAHCCVLYLPRFLFSVHHRYPCCRRRCHNSFILFSIRNCVDILFPTTECHCMKPTEIYRFIRANINGGFFFLLFVCHSDECGTVCGHF